SFGKNSVANIFFFCRKIQDQMSEPLRSSCSFFDCLFFNQYANAEAIPHIDRIIKKEKLFSRRYIFVPVIERSHWYLIIFCHIGNKNLRCILLLDSLGYGNRSYVEPVIRRFLNHFYERKRPKVTPQDLKSIPLLCPKIPKQKGASECGIYVLFYTHLFLKMAPEVFKRESFPYFMTPNWFTDDDIKRFAREI
ncbi:hypothetical protein M569_10069, partial [Genlisea aurea]